mmetsp:Transcript_63926/g.178855  ORF Transcript_63926/g.178855 Transcript_63926/m.178855 type:complete len:230 (+) Transcript_63926:269-958(+)
MHGGRNKKRSNRHDTHATCTLQTLHFSQAAQGEHCQQPNQGHGQALVHAIFHISDSLHNIADRDDIRHCCTSTENQNGNLHRLSPFQAQRLLHHTLISCQTVKATGLNDQINRGCRCPRTGQQQQESKHHPRLIHSERECQNTRTERCRAQIGNGADKVTTGHCTRTRARDRGGRTIGKDSGLGMGKEAIQGLVAVLRRLFVRNLGRAWAALSWIFQGRNNDFLRGHTF